MDATPGQRTPPSETMMGLITGYWVSQAVGAVAQLGVADVLTDGPQPAEAIARRVGADGPALYRVLRLLASLGVFREGPPGTFALTPLGETLRSGAPGSVRNYAITETAPGHWLPWGHLLESVRSGGPMAHQALGMELFGWYAKNPEEAGYFSAAMGDLAALTASEMVRVYDCSTVRQVVDVGGAHGVLLSAVLRTNPAARGVLLDLPHVIATAREAIASSGLDDRCELVSGDFFEHVPEGGDLHLLKQIVHDWNDEQAAQVLRNCRRALAPGGRLLLVEMVIPPDDRPALSKGMDLNMLVLLGGRERTEEEFGRLLASAGFRLERVIPTHSPFSVIEAAPV